MKKIIAILVLSLFWSFQVVAQDEDSPQYGGNSNNSSWDNHDTYLSPYHKDAYGPGVNSDSTGRPFQWKTQGGQTVPPGSIVEPNGYGLGVGKDEYGRPVKTEPWP